MSELTPMQAKFVAAYLANGGNGHAAAKAAGYKHPNVEGHRLLENDRIRAQVSALLPETILSGADKVVSAWQGIAHADHAELVRYKRGACRYCHGEGGRYQRTPAEREHDWGAHQEMVAEAMRGAKSARMLKAIPQFDEMGGANYDRNAKPNPNCAECGGDGVGRVIVADTDELSPEARALYAGVKQTRDGIEVKTHDKATALAALAKFHKVAGHTAAEQAEGAQPTVHLHLHLMRLLGDLPAEERAVARKLITMLNGQGVIEG